MADISLQYSMYLSQLELQGTIIIVLFLMTLKDGGETLRGREGNYRITIIVYFTYLRAETDDKKDAHHQTRQHQVQEMRPVHQHHVDSTYTRTAYTQNVDYQRRRRPYFLDALTNTEATQPPHHPFICCRVFGSPSCHDKLRPHLP